MEIGHVLMVLCYVITRVHLVNSNGELYVGFLGYSNPQNIKYDGECCDGNKTLGQCDDMCDLLFNVSVSFLNSSSVYQSPTNIAIDNNEAEKFSLNREYPNIINPLKFVFGTWPGIVNITIDVYDQDKESKEIVDKFIFSFETTTPSLLYSPSAKLTGMRTSSPSNIKMVFRYECDSPREIGNYCVNEKCVTYPSETECPTIYTKPQNNQMTTSGCERVTIPGIENLGGCKDTSSDQTTEFTITTEPTAQETGQTNEFSITSEQTSEATVSPEQTTETTIVSDRTSGSSKNIDQRTDSLIFDQTTSTEELTTSHVIITSAKETATLSTASETTTNLHLPSTLSIDTKQSEPVTLINKVTTYSSTSSMRTTTTRTKSTPEMSTEHISTVDNKTPKNKSSRTLNNIPINNQRSISPETVTNSTVLEVQTTIRDTSDGPMKYWPGIVGGVLGAIVLVALVSYIIYIRRKRLNKNNNDIYNVNPKRWVLEAPEENGTSGKSEIALETEQV